METEIIKHYCSCGAALTIKGEWPEADRQQMLDSWDQHHGTKPGHEPQTKEQWEATMLASEDSDLAWPDEVE